MSAAPTARITVGVFLESGMPDQRIFRASIYLGQLGFNRTKQAAIPIAPK
jgi:hypothetical protein